MMFLEKAGRSRTTMTDRSAAPFARRLEEAAGRALDSAGVESCTLKVAGRVVRLDFAGDALVPALLPAFAHLLADAAQAPEVIITLWDTQSTGVSLPPLPWSPPEGEAWKVVEQGQRGFYLPFRGSLIWYEENSNRAYYWNETALNVFEEESFSPLLSFWAWFSARHNIQLAHAAAVSGPAGAALLVGAGGSGKSTTALLTLLSASSPLHYIADDYCLVSLEAQPVVFSLYATAKVIRADHSRHPALAPAFVRSNAEKSLYFLHPHFAGRIRQQAPLKAVIAPTITGAGTSTFEHASPAELLRRLAPSTLVQLHVGIDPAQALKNLSELVRRLPCFRLNLGTDFDRIPGLIASRLEELG